MQDLTFGMKLGFFVLPGDLLLRISVEDLMEGVVDMRLVEIVRDILLGMEFGV